MLEKLLQRLVGWFGLCLAVVHRRALVTHSFEHTHYFGLVVAHVDDDEDQSQRVGNLFDLSARPAQAQGSQGASMDPFGNLQPAAAKIVNPAKQSATGSLLDEDDIMGVLSSSDPKAAAAQHAAKAAQQIAPGSMSQQEAIFGQR